MIDGAGDQIDEKYKGDGNPNSIYNMGKEMASRQGRVPISGAR